MSLIRSAGNKETELTFAKVLRRCRISGWRRGASVFGKPDFVFWKGRVAVFIDGCFWHHCPRHGTIPKTRRKYWKQKLLRNIERAREVNRELRRGGWKVLRIWSCELRDHRRLPRKLRRLHDMLNTT
ncbi:MAG: very short patch repair endonuclease [Gammaproteobacteria bacterium]|nr:very short patch repair endonuclease [Gammaproteobacteria bacterium]